MQLVCIREGIRYCVGDPALTIETNSVHDECVAFPRANRLPHPTWIQVFRMSSSIQEDLARGRDIHLANIHQKSRSLNEFIQPEGVQKRQPPPTRQASRTRDIFEVVRRPFLDCGRRPRQQTRFFIHPLTGRRKIDSLARPSGCVLETLKVRAHPAGRRFISLSTRAQHRQNPDFVFDRDQSLASRAAIEAFIKTTGAQLWIEHDLAHFNQLKKAPSYYE